MKDLDSMLPEDRDREYGDRMRAFDPNALTISPREVKMLDHVQRLENILQNFKQNLAGDLNSLAPDQARFKLRVIRDRIESMVIAHSGNRGE